MIIVLIITGVGDFYNIFSPNKYKLIRYHCFYL